MPLTRPGKHITSVTTANAELIGKRLQLLTEMVPGARRVGTFIDPASLASCFEEVDLMGQSAKALGLSLLRIEVAACKDFDAEAALQRAVATKVQSVETELMTSD